MHETRVFKAAPEFLIAVRRCNRRPRGLVNFSFNGEMECVLRPLQKYADVPKSLADACLVRMPDTTSNAVILITGSEFRVYRGHSRQLVGVMPS